MSRLTARDCARIGICVMGQKKFFDTHGLDYRRFLREGFDPSEFAGIDNKHLDAALAEMKRREAGEDGRG